MKKGNHKASRNKIQITTYRTQQGKAVLEGTGGIPELVNTKIRLLSESG